MYLNNQLFDNSNGSFRDSDIIRTSVSGRLILKGGDLLRFDYMASTLVPQGDLDVLPSGTPSLLSSKLYSYSHVVPSAPAVPLIKTLMPFFSPGASSIDKCGVLLELEPAPSSEHNKATSFEYQIRFASGSSVWIGSNTLSSTGANAGPETVATLSRGLNVIKAGVEHGPFAIFANGNSIQFRVRGKNSAATLSSGDWSEWSLMVSLGSPASVNTGVVAAAPLGKKLGDANFGVKLSWPAIVTADINALGLGHSFVGWTLTRVDRNVSTLLVEDTRELEFFDSLSDTSYRSVTYYLQAKTQNNSTKSNTLSAPSTIQQTISDNPSISIPQVISMPDGDHLVFKVKANSLRMNSSYAIGVPSLDSPENVNPVVTIGVSDPDIESNFVSYDVALGYRLAPEKSFTLIMVNHSGLSSILRNNM